MPWTDGVSANLLQETQAVRKQHATKHQSRHDAQMGSGTDDDETCVSENLATPTGERVFPEMQWKRTLTGSPLSYAA